MRNRYYAIAVSSRLAANGIHGQLIFYRWHIRNTPITGNHVFVVYRLPDGSEWIVDNEIPQPKRVPLDATPMQLVFLLGDDPQRLTLSFRRRCDFGSGDEAIIGQRFDFWFCRH